MLKSRVHYEFFKRFMATNKASPPLMFWKAVDDMSNIHNEKMKLTRLSQIKRKYFGKLAKYGNQTPNVIMEMMKTSIRLKVYEYMW